MKNIKLKRDEPRFIQSRKYDWRELDGLIARGELVEIECPTPEEARSVSINLRKTDAARAGVYTVLQSGNAVTVDATRRASHDSAR